MTAVASLQQPVPAPVNGGGGARPFPEPAAETRRRAEAAPAAAPDGDGRGILRGNDIAAASRSGETRGRAARAFETPPESEDIRSRERRSPFTEDGRAAFDTGPGRPPLFASLLFRVQQFAQELLLIQPRPVPEPGTTAGEAYGRSFKLGVELFGGARPLDIVV